MNIDYYQLAKEMFVQRFEQMNEQSAFDIQEQKLYNAQMQQHEIQLQEQIEDTIESITDPKLRQMCRDFCEEVEGEGEKAFVKEFTKRDKRFKQREYNPADLWGDGNSDNFFPM